VASYEDFEKQVVMHCAILIGNEVGLQVGMAFSHAHRGWKAAPTKLEKETSMQRPRYSLGTSV